MTNGLFWTSYGAVWILLIAVSGGLLVLFRFSARAYRVQAPFEIGDVGALNGPALDASPPILELRDLGGDIVLLGRPNGAAQLIVFAKSTCPRCRVAIQFLRTFTSENAPLETIVVCGGGRAVVEDCASLVGSPLVAVADSQGTGAKRWAVSRWPFGVVLDSTGFVRARGDPTSTALLAVLTRHLESSRDGTSPNQRTMGDSPAHL